MTVAKTSMIAWPRMKRRAYITTVVSGSSGSPGWRSLSSFLQLSAYQLQPVFLPAIISLSAAACLPSCNYQPISCSLSYFLQLSAYQLQHVLLPAIISLSAAACLPSCNYQPISCSLSSFLQLSANQLQPVFLPATISCSLSSCLQFLAYHPRLSPPCHYQFTCFVQFLHAIISQSDAACLPSCNYQPIRPTKCSLSSLLQ